MTNPSRRRARLDTLALADGDALRALWRGITEPEHTVIRGPEVGLVALRGRIGGGGAPFHLAEASVARASVRLADGRTGHAIALGRDTEKARISALVDAMAQADDQAAELEDAVLAPLRNDREERDAARSAETAATKVDFFTVARGED